MQLLCIAKHLTLTVIKDNVSHEHCQNTDQVRVGTLRQKVGSTGQNGGCLTLVMGYIFTHRLRTISAASKLTPTATIISYPRVNFN